MKRRIGKTFNSLPLSVKILCGFLLICLALTVASGVLYYGHAKGVVEDSIWEQASLLCRRFEHDFTAHYAAPTEYELRLLVTSPQLNNYLMSPKEEMLVHRADVERLFLSLSQGRDLYVSTTFLDESGQERIGTSGSTRKREFRSLAQIADEGRPGRSLNEVFTKLKSAGAGSLVYSAPFYDARKRLVILVGMAMQEPEAGGFGGAVVQHCDLTDFVREVSSHKILGTAVVWVYGSDGETLASPSEGETQQAPGPRLPGAKPSVDRYVHTAACRLLPGDEPAMTVVCRIPSVLVSRELAPVIRSVLLTFSVLFAGSLASSLLISRRISGRIRTLTKAAQAVSAERLDLDLDARLRESTDEIGILANTFQMMILDLKKSTTSIENLNREVAGRRQAQEALRQERDRAQGYLDIADVLLLALNEKGQITLINRKGSRILGYEEQELLGRNWFETCLPPPVQTSVQETFGRLMAGEIEMARCAENAVRTRSGEERILAWHNAVLRDDTGRIVGTLSSGEDITERKRAEEELRESVSLLKATLEATADGILVVDTAGRIKGCNRQFAELWQIPDAVLELRDDNAALNAVLSRLKDPGAFLSRVRELYEHPDVESFDILEFVDGRIIERHSRPHRLGDRIVGRVWSFRDITDRHLAQHKQAALLRQVTEINEELTHFAYVVSHDLKAPLRGIKLVTEWLCADYADTLDGGAREQFDLLQSRVQRMHDLIDGILQYSRIGRIKEEIVPVDLNELLSGIIDTIAPPAHIHIAVDDGLPTLECEKTRIVQVFQNLLTNAVKYMDKPVGEIRVGCVEEGDFWKFSVADNGPGIEERHFDRVFRIFQTLAPRDEFESTGIGLTLVKKIVEMYGGRIWVKSEVGRGSTFFFTLPRHKAAITEEEHEYCTAGRG